MEVVHHPQIVAYLDAVCAQVQYAETHAEIRLEMAGHLADRTQAGLDAGLSEADAVAQAIQFSGDPIMVGRQLNQAHQPRTDWKLLGATLLLVLLGIWAMYAIEVSGSSPIVGFNLFVRKLIWSAVGLVGAFAAMILDYRLLRRLGWPLLAATLLGMFWAGTLGPRANGQAQWLSLAPLVLAPALAGIFATWDWQAPRAWLKGLGVLLMPLLALVIWSSIFTVLEYGVLFWVIAVASRPSRRQAWPMAAASVPLLWTVLQRPYLRNRLLGWLHPQSDPLGMTYPVVQSLESLRQAGPWGHGPTATVRTLPAVHTDFVFPYLVFSLGWVTGIAICLLAFYFLFRLARVARKTREPFGLMLVRGALVLFGLEIGWNVLMTVGLVPTAGPDLPFISYGGHEVVYMAAVGLVLSVIRRKDIIRVLDEDSIKMKLA